MIARPKDIASAALTRTAAGAVLALAALAAAVPASAQRLADRVAAVGNGDVRFSYPARDGVCRSIRGDGWTVRGRNSDYWESDCIGQQIQVTMSLDRGRVSTLRFRVGVPTASEGETDLGTVSAGEAVGYLMSLAATGEERVSDRAIPGAALAEDADVWRELIGIARDGARPQRVRRTATFWVSQAAGERITAELSDLALSDSADLEIREHAVFALSQRPADEGIPALMEIARSKAHPAIRRRALFWLGQSRDPRALALFEEILTQSRGQSP